jgi:hypothetical protein
VYVVFTTIHDTLPAVRVGHRLAEALSVPLTLLHFRAVPFVLPVDAPTDISPLETEDFVARLQDEGIDVRVRVFLCRDEHRTIPFAFKSHSLVVLGGHSSWLPTHAERWRRSLEAAGHFVLVVDPSRHDAETRQEHVDA